MYKLELLDICLPDYFAGFNGPTLAVPVHHGMTGKELKEEIIREYYDICDSLPEVDISAAVNEFVVAEDTAILFQELEPDNEDDVGDSCYMYIAIVEE